MRLTTALNTTNWKLNRGHKASGQSRAFTLIELLTVIAIISIIAALVVSLGGGAKNKQKRALVEAERTKLEALIENYREKMGFYPPDNRNVTNDAVVFAGTNQLLYELAGASFDPTKGDPITFDILDQKIQISADAYDQRFGRGGVANSVPVNGEEKVRNFFTTGIKEKQYKRIPGDQVAYGLVVPVDLNGNSTNFWHYDCSSTNRHNADSYDLWAVFSIGSEIVTNGNWKD